MAVLKDDYTSVTFDYLKIGEIKEFIDNQNVPFLGFCYGWSSENYCEEDKDHFSDKYPPTYAMILTLAQSYMDVDMYIKFLPLGQSKMRNIHLSNAELREVFSYYGKTLLDFNRDYRNYNESKTKYMNGIQENTVSINKLKTMESQLLLMEDEYSVLQNKLDMYKSQLIPLYRQYYLKENPIVLL